MVAESKDSHSRSGWNVLQVLDHLGMNELPGDSLAVMDVLGYRNCTFVRDPRVPYQSYVVIE